MQITKEVNPHSHIVPCVLHLCHMSALLELDQCLVEVMEHQQVFGGF